MTHSGASDPQPAYDVGVLFVHGIGQPSQRSTLRGFGEPFCDWIVRRLRLHVPWRGAGAPEPSLREIPIAADGITPAHAELNIPASGGAASRWLLAESWWAHDIDTPTFATLAGWGLRAIPWTLGAHFARRIKLAWLRARQATRVEHKLARSAALLLELGLFAASIGLSALLVAGSLLLSLLALIPMPWLGRLLRRIQGALAATIGDSYALVERRLGGESAIVGRVQHDMRWLARRCRYVAVVAHSQGAAAAHLALRRPDAARADGDAPVSLLLTIGSGVRKLEELRQSETSNTSAGLLLCAPLVLIVTLSLAWTRPDGVFVWGLGLCLLLVLAAAPPLFSPIGEREMQERLLKEHLGWKDFYATHDPVPNGRVFLEDHVVSSPVSNRASWWRDHTSYWANRDELVSQLVSALGRDLHERAIIPGELGAALALPEHELKSVAAQRARRVAWLRWAKWAASAASAAVAWLSPTASATLTAWLLSGLPASVATRLPSFDEWQRAPLVDLMQLGTAALLAGLACLLIGLLWRAWDSSDVAAFFAGQVYNERALGRVAFACGATLIVALLCAWAATDRLPRDWAAPVPWIAVGLSSALAGVASQALQARWLRRRGPLDLTNRKPLQAVELL